MTLNTTGQIKIGAYFQPEISFANIEQYWFTPSFGIMSNILIYKQLSFIVGIGYKSKQIDGGWLSYLHDQIPTDTYLAKTIPLQIKLKYNFLSPGKKIEFYAIGGTIFDFCFYQKFTYDLSGEPDNISNKFDYYDGHISLGLGVEYQLNRISFFGEPAFNIGFAHNRNYYHPYTNSVSMNLGIYYIIKPKKQSKNLNNR
ncbi:MAG: hypothetical protein HQ542_00105 [Bacteroidia bacterium]|nr:hypothetical protein [Bacteroidia bacterium]